MKNQIHLMSDFQTLSIVTTISGAVIPILHMY